MEENTEIILTETEPEEPAKAGAGKESGARRGRKSTPRRAFVIVLLIGMVLLGLFTAGLRMFTMRPYAVTINGKDICYIKDDAEAKKVMKEVLGDLIPKDADLKLIKANDALRIDRAGRVTMGDVKVMKAKDASRAIKDALAGTKDGSKVEITTVSTRKEIHSVKPDVKYQKDETMLVGESEVVTEGKKGKEERLMSYTCVNGEVVDEDVLKTTVIEKGRSKVIRKGVLGLPEGEDWITYDGDPVYEDGEDLVTTSMNYLGAPYKYGGTSLENGIDCVAFVVQMYAKYGIKIPSSHSGLHKIGVGVSLDKAQKGDIICYDKHVGIYVGDGQMIEATSRHGVRVGKVNEKRLVTVRRVVGN